MSAPAHCGKGQHGGAWNDVNVAECKRLALLGWSGSQIARQLGMTRNQVIGKVARMGLMLGGGNGVAQHSQHEVRRVKANSMPPAPSATSIRVSSNGRRAYPVSIGEPPAPSAPGPAGTVSLLDLDAHACRWPYGDGPFTFCGKPVEGDGPYCRACVVNHRPHQPAYGMYSDARLMGAGRKHTRKSAPTFDDYERKAGRA